MDEIPRKRHRQYKYRPISRPGNPSDRPESVVTSVRAPPEVLAERDRLREERDAMDPIRRMFGDPEPGRRRW